MEKKIFYHTKSPCTLGVDEKQVYYIWQVAVSQRSQSFVVRIEELLTTKAWDVVLSVPNVLNC